MVELSGPPHYQLSPHELADLVGFFVGGHLGSAADFGEMDLAG